MTGYDYGIITFYLLKSWGLGPSVAIERGLEEYKNPDISHNVEYSLHPVKFIERFEVIARQSVDIFASIREGSQNLSLQVRLPIVLVN